MTQTAVSPVTTAQVALRSTYETCVHFDGPEVMLVIPKYLWLEMRKPKTLRIVLTEED